jgi:hypothetical protein
MRPPALERTPSTYIARHSDAPETNRVARVLLAPSRLALVPGGRVAMSDHSPVPESSIYAPQQRAAPGQQDDASPTSAAVEPVTLLPGPAPPPPPFGVDPLIQPPRQRPAAPALNGLPTAAPGANPIALWMVKADRSLQRFLDRLAPHQLYRWLGLGTFFRFLAVANACRLPLMQKSKRRAVCLGRPL